jgi:hypothetical protein
MPRKFQILMRLEDTTHSREWMPMIFQATLAAAIGLKALIVTGVLFQIAIVTRLTKTLLQQSAAELPFSSTFPNRCRFWQRK